MNRRKGLWGRLLALVAIVGLALLAMPQPGQTQAYLNMNPGLIFPISGFTMIVAPPSSLTGQRTITIPDVGMSPSFVLLQRNGSAPTAAAGANAGTSPPSPVVTAGSTDSRGNTTWGTGTTPAAGAQVVVTFNTPWAAAPIVILMETTLATHNTTSNCGGVYVTNVTTTAFTVNCQQAPAASQGNTVFGVNWLALQ